MTSGTEVPAEFNIGFPDLGVANIAENANPTHHDLRRAVPRYEMRKPGQKPDRSDRHVRLC